MRHLIFALALLVVPRAAWCQQHEIYCPTIASLTVIAGSDWQGLPITTLDGKGINIAFDELSHDYHRYTYTVTHCEADWTPSEGLFATDYIEGFFNDNVISDYELSDGTYQLYTHYRLSIPNRQCRLTMSGNYRLTVYDDDSDEAVLSACFMVCEEQATIGMSCTTNTDIDINISHQQLTLDIDYSRLRVINPDQQLYLVVMQNQRRDNAVVNPKATFRANNHLRYEHCRELIFDGGNEYHKFETLDPTHATMGLESVGWDKDAAQWHAYVVPDEPRRNYLYDVDANGSFLIRNSDDEDNATTCDYIMTHFTLHTPRQTGTVYLDGAWTYGQRTPRYEMLWNYAANVYEGAVLLKQGYYSYQYLVMIDDGSLHSLASDGNFYQTENAYQALLYYKGNADRAFRLVGFNTIRPSQR